MFCNTGATESIGESDVARPRRSHKSGGTFHRSSGKVGFNLRCAEAEERNYVVTRARSRSSCASNSMAPDAAAVVEQRHASKGRPRKRSRSHAEERDTSISADSVPEMNGFVGVRSKRRSMSSRSSVAESGTQSSGGEDGKTSDIVISDDAIGHEEDSQQSIDCSSLASESEDAGRASSNSSRCTDLNAHYDDDDHHPFLPGLDDGAALRCLAFVPLIDVRQLARVNKQYRALVETREIFKLRHEFGVVEHWVFIYTSGPGGWTAYNPKSNSWMELPEANVNPIFNMSDRESLSAGTQVLWLGREAFDFVYYRYDLLTNVWQRGPPMANPRWLFASASCGDFAFVAGGFGPDNEGGVPLRLLNSAERYNSLNGQWEPLPPMSIPRQKCSGFYMDGKFYVIGGKDAQHQPIMSGEEYDPITRIWRTIDNMYFAPEAAHMYEPSPPLVAVVDNQLYAVDNTTNILKHYNKQNNIWNNLGHLPVRADLNNGWGVAFKALGDRLFVMGDIEGIVAFTWRPRSDSMVPDWQLLSRRERGSDSFLLNCAVMTC